MILKITKAETPEAKTAAAAAKKQTVLPTPNKATKSDNKGNESDCPC